jgi:hypothetical protein
LFFHYITAARPALGFKISEKKALTFLARMI